MNICKSQTTLFELPSGMLSERLGERALLVLGLLFAGVGYLALAMAVVVLLPLPLPLPLSALLLPTMTGKCAA